MGNDLERNTYLLGEKVEGHVMFDAAIATEWKESRKTTRNQLSGMRNPLEPGAIKKVPADICRLMRDRTTAGEYPLLCC